MTFRLFSAMSIHNWSIFEELNLDRFFDQIYFVATHDYLNVNNFIGKLENSSFVSSLVLD